MGGNGGNGVIHHTAEDTPNNNNGLVNVNESSSMSTITETRAIITPANQRHQQMQSQQQQQLQQQQQRQRNTIRSDTITTSNDIGGHHNTIFAVDDNFVNNMKISQICNVENRSGILSGVMPMLVKTSPPQQSSALTTSTTTMVANNNSLTSSVSTIQSKLSKSTTDIHDIDRLFLNTSHALSDNGVIMSNDFSTTTTVDDMNRKDLVTIVTISGCTNTESSTGEMDILAHL